MATLGNQAEPQRIVEPATGEVQRTAHVAMSAANPMTFGTSAGTKFDADNYSTTNYATPQGEKLLMDIQLDQGVKLAKPTSTPDDHVAEDPIVGGNPKIKLTSDVPGLVVRTAPLTADDIPNVDSIGGGAHETKEINGIPITPQIAAEVRSAEDKAGHSTGKGLRRLECRARLRIMCGRGSCRRWALPTLALTPGIIDDKASKGQSLFISSMEPPLTQPVECKILNLTAQYELQGRPAFVLCIRF